MSASELALHSSQAGILGLVHEGLPARAEQQVLQEAGPLGRQPPRTQFSGKHLAQCWEAGCSIRSRAEEPCEGGSLGPVCRRAHLQAPGDHSQRVVHHAHQEGPPRVAGRGERRQHLPREQLPRAEHELGAGGKARIVGWLGRPELPLVGRVRQHGLDASHRLRDGYQAVQLPLAGPSAHDPVLEARGVGAEGRALLEAEDRPPC
mmetsp:Transcript_162181/g.393965  ORF Transcript_162181/g.393965 Transcript_162181/m.393965 type:complete len:205 (+) Transcript_162181:106-720(+)